MFNYQHIIKILLKKSFSKQLWANSLKVDGSFNYFLGLKGVVKTTNWFLRKPSIHNTTLIHECVTTPTGKWREQLVMGTLIKTSKSLFLKPKVPFFLFSFLHYLKFHLTKKRDTGRLYNYHIVPVFLSNKNGFFFKQLQEWLEYGTRIMHDTQIQILLVLRFKKMLHRFTYFKKPRSIKKSRYKLLKLKNTTNMF